MIRNWKAPAWLLANIAAAGAFLFLTSAAWIAPELRDQPGSVAGGAVVWGFGALPVLALFVTLNACIFLRACLVRIARGSWPVAALSWLSIPVWLCAAAIDHVHR